MGKIIFRSASISDAEMLLRWRNDPITRRMSRQMDKIHENNHIVWLKNIIRSSSRKLFIAQIDNHPIGVLRSELEDNIHEISWTVAPEERGKGWGKKIVAEFIASVPGVVCANIKPENVASIVIAVKAGMELIKKENGMLHFQKCNSL